MLYNQKNLIHDNKLEWKEVKMRDITIVGLTQNTLKHVSLSIPKEKITVSVSYTHLDVYKRQIYDG